MLNITIPKDISKFKKSITALEWQIKQDNDNKDKRIHQKALAKFKQALKERGE